MVSEVVYTKQLSDKLMKSTSLECAEKCTGQTPYKDEKFTPSLNG